MTVAAIPATQTAAKATADSVDEFTALIQAAQAGDEDSFRHLYRTHHPLLLRYLTGLVGGDAEDVASEAWLHIARDLGRFQGDADGFRGWTATVARNRALDHLRKQQRRPVIGASEEVLLSVPSDDDTATSASDGIASAQALELIASLPREQAEAILLRVVIGLDATAAGKVLGKRAGTVRTAAYRGLRRLADLLKPAPASAQ